MSLPPNISKNPSLVVFPLALFIKLLFVHLTYELDAVAYILKASNTGYILSNGFAGVKSNFGPFVPSHLQNLSSSKSPRF